MISQRSRAKLLSILCTTAGTAALAGAAPAGAAVSCDKVASPTGSDTAAGTEAAPYRTAKKLANSVSAGQTGCLRAGTYSQAVKVSRSGASGTPLTLRNYPGEKATLVGRLWVEGSYVTLSDLYLDGQNSSILPSPSVTGDDVRFVRNDVTNNHTAICFSLGHPSYGRAVRTVIESNTIHNCGRLPATNHDHGIYVTAADDTLIKGNWIYDNADRGVQIYPDAQRTVVTGNVVDANGQGVAYGGEVTTSNNNMVKDNVITNAKLRYNVESWWASGTPVGQGNVAQHNCVKGGPYDSGNGGIGAQVGFTASNNLVVDPGYMNRSGKDFRLSSSSPCLALDGNWSALPGPEGSGGSEPDPAPASRSADTTAPDTTIASGPSGSTTDTSAIFAFTSTETGSSFECRLDGGSWAACTTPRSYSGLSVGSHTFEVRAKDAAGNQDASPATRSWSITAPVPNEDKARGRVTTASSYLNSHYSPSRGNDGRSDTRWISARQDGQWWRVDLGRVRQVDKVSINWDWTYASRYLVETSTDGVNYTTATDVSISKFGWAHSTFSARSARYVRIRSVTRATRYGVAIWDAQVFGAAD